jgi:NADH-quinone oxidoreductase subunit M
VVTFLPLAGALLILLVPKANERLVRILATVASGLALVASLDLLFRFNPSTTAMQFVERLPWVPSLAINYAMGVDGLSISMIVLTTLLSFLSVIASYNIPVRQKEYFSLFLLLETGMLGVFLALDLFLFYVFWEIVLVPMYFLIGIWGGPRKEYAAIKFFLYTLAGSVLMLLAILALYFRSEPHTLDILTLQANHPLDFTLQRILFLAFYVGFAIKVPVFPFHTWLPDAHVEAPTAISVLLAGVLLKMGLYGFFRIGFPIFPEAARWFAPYMAILAMINIVYGALVSMAQSDFKKMIAYSSVNHMGYCLLGMSAFTLTGFNGAIFEMWNHGIITGGLFLLVGVLYDRAHTRGLGDFGGLSSKVPVYAGMLSVASFASLGLPGLAGFVSEFMCFAGAFPVHPTITIISIAGIVVTAAFFLIMIQRVLLGPLNPRWEKLPDMSRRDLVTLVPLVIIMFALGLYPLPFIRLITAATQGLLQMIGGL